MTRTTSPEPEALIAALKQAPCDLTVEMTLQRAVQSSLAIAVLGFATAPQPSTLAVLRAPAVGSKAGVALSKAALAFWLGTVFSVGVATGLGADRWVAGSAQPAPMTQAPDRSHVPAPVPATPEPLVGVEPSQLALVETTTQRATPSAAASSTDVGSSLSIERRILDEARKALAQGQPAAGLAPLERHRARFPKGVLAEEREALFVRVLAATGDHGAALVRAQAFERRFPESIFLPAVKNAVGAISERGSDDASKP